MKLTRTIKVSKEEFYDFLENDLLSTIKQCTNKEIRVKDIKKGLHYTQLDQRSQTNVTVTILDYQRGRLYKSKIKTVADTVTIFYKTEQVEDGLKIVFNQHISGFEDEKHNKFMRMFSEAVYFGRMADTLYDIQTKIVNKREGIQVTPKQQPLEHKHLKKLFARELRK